MPDPRCVRCGQRVPWLTLGGNLSLGVYKLILALVGNSKALLADAVHSFCDVVGTMMTIFSRRLSGRPSDSGHNYGHGKVEFLGSVFIYSVVFVVGIGLIVGGAQTVIEAKQKSPRLITIVAAAISVLVNRLMYLLCQCAGGKNHSPAIIADGFENRADAISSAAVIVGIAASIWLHPIFDPLAAMIVGVIILHNCLIQMWEVLGGLMDRALPAQVVERIREAALSHPGVTGVAFVKTRRTGPSYWLDLGICVPATMAVQEADALAERVRADLRRRSERFHHVEVFVGHDPAPAAPDGEPTLMVKDRAATL